MKPTSRSAFLNPFLNSLIAAGALLCAGQAQAALTWSDSLDYSGGYTAWTTWTYGWDGNTTPYVNGSDVIFNGGGGSYVAVWETQHYNVGSMSFSGKDYTVGTTPGTGHAASLTLTNGNIDVESGRTATFLNNAGSGQFYLQGSAGITKTGGGTLVISAPSNITGTVNVNAGKLQIGNGSMNGSIASTSGINNSAVVDFNVIGTQAYTAGIVGTGSLTKSGSGTLSLAGTNTYSGTTNITGGTLSASVYAGAARHFDASTLGLADGADISTWNDLSGNGANATVPGGNDNPTYIANAGTGTGLGAVSFLGNNGANDSQALTFTRDTNVRSVFSIFKGSSFLLTDTQGQYDLHRPSNTDPADPLIANYGQVDYLGAVYVNGTAVNPTVDAMPTGSNNGYNLVEVITNGTPMQLDGFNKDRVYHSGNQSHAETILFDTVVSETQRLQIEAFLNKKWFGTGPGVGNLLSTTSDMVLSGGGKIDLSGENFQTLKSLSATDNSGTQVILGSAALTVGDAANTSFDGAISGSGGSLTKSGAGTLTLTGANTYTGTTTVSTGVLQVGDGGTTGSLGSGAVTNNASLVFNRSNAATVSNNIGGSGSLTKQGAGTLALTGSLAYTGGTTVSGGTLELPEGDWHTGNPWGPGGASGAIIVGSGATLSTSAGVTNIGNGLTLNGGTVSSRGLTYDGTWGNLFLSSDITAGNAAASTISSYVVLTGNRTMSVGTDSTLSLSGKITDWNHPNSGITKTGAGTLTLSGANSYGGKTDINEGTLIAANSSALGVSGWSGTNMTQVYDGATLALQGNVSINDHMHVVGAGVGGLGAIRSLSGNNALTMYSGGSSSGPGYAIDGNTTIGVDADTLTVTGFYHDSGSYGITKVGAGTLTLTSSSTYSGGTAVSEGKLVVNGSTSATGAVTVASGATLGGSGTVGGATTIQNGGHLAVGNSPGIQTFSSTLDLQSGSIFDWDLAGNTNSGRGSNYDGVDVTGTLTIASDAVFRVIQNTGLDFNDTFWDTSRTWTDIFSAGTLTSNWSNAAVEVYNTSNVLQNVSSFGSFTISGSTLTWTAVPEPTSALAGLLVAAGLLRRRRVP